jgi:hypothetical protein
MPEKTDSVGPSKPRQLALSTWDNEGGAGPRGPRVGSISDDALSEALR